MRKKKSHAGVFLLIFIIIISAIVYYCFFNKTEDKEDETIISESTVEQMTILNTMSNSSSVTSALIENIELHATYYYEEMYFKENEYVEEGENILKYTNGTYLTAPYNCVITEISIPEKGEKCTNSHYITVQSTEILTMSLTVGEDELDTVYIGQEAQISVDVVKEKIYTGYVTNVSNIATYSSNGSKFTVTVEFENDGQISIGMSATCNVVLEKAENAIAVPVEAIYTENRQKYVIVKNEDGTTENIIVETGISNDAYTEITSNNLSIGQIVLIEKTESNNSNSFNNQRDTGGNSRGGMQESKSNFDFPSSGEMPSGMQMRKQ